MVKTAKAPKAKKPASGEDGKTQKKKKAPPSYKSYLYKLVKKADTGSGIGDKGLMVFNDMIEYVERLIAESAYEAANFEKKRTLSSKHVRSATHMLLMGQLGGLAVQQGQRAVEMYKESMREAKEAAEAKKAAASAP